MSCSQQQLNWSAAQPPPSPGTGAYPGGAWDMNAHHLNGSNMSLNIMPSGYYPQRQAAMQRSDMPPPAAWFNGGWAAAPMYPYPMGMMPVHPAGKPLGCSTRSNNHLYVFVYFFPLQTFTIAARVARRAANRVPLRQP